MLRLFDMALGAVSLLCLAAPLLADAGLPVDPKATDMRAVEAAPAELMYGVVGDRKLNGCTLKEILVAMGIPAENVEDVELKEAKDLSRFNVLIVAETAAVGPVSARPMDDGGGSRIVDFVADGGICWIMHQDATITNLNMFPPESRRLEFTLRYVPAPEIGGMAMEYVGPWIVDKHHPIFQKPNYLDERHFVQWEIKAGDKTYQTTALEVLSPTSDWAVLGKFQDHTTRDAALIVEQGHKQGTYIWTQLLSPQLVWGDESSIAKECWTLLLENLLTYFADLQKGEPPRIEMTLWPRTARAGQDIFIQVEGARETSRKILAVDVEIEKPDGTREAIQLPKTPYGGQPHFLHRYSGYTPNLPFVPRQRGSYSFKAVAKFEDGAIAQDHGLLKVSRGWTPYRFVTHMHAGRKPDREDASSGNYGSVGLLRGVAIRMGIDALFAADLPWGDEVRGYRKLMGVDDVDDGFCRFFYGSELHYNETPPEHASTSKHGGHHICAYGIPIHPPHDVMGLFDPRDVRTIWEYGGIAVAAHPERCDWYTRYDLDLDGVELHDYEAQDRGATAANASDTPSGTKEVWDGQLQKGKRITSLIGIDDSYPALVTRQEWSIAWLDGALTEHNLIQAIKEQRVISCHQIDHVWFDIGGVPVGSTVWVVDNVPLQVDVRDDGNVGRIDLIRDGEVVANSVVNEREASFTKRLTVDSDTYYRVEIYGEGWAVTNPIWVKKIDGPTGCWFGATMSSVAKTTWDGRLWSIELEAPDRGQLVVHVPRRPSIRVNSESIEYDWDEASALASISLLRGGHTISIEWP